MGLPILLLGLVSEIEKNFFNYLYQDSLEDCFTIKENMKRLYNSLYENTEVTN